MIIWINGGFGTGKATLAEELHRQLPEAVVCNPKTSASCSSSRCR